MSDLPWLEDSDPSLGVERSLLKRLNAQQPPAGSVERGWAALAADISGLPALDSPGTGPADPIQGAPQLTTAGFGITAKIALGVAITGGALWGGIGLLTSDEPPSSPRRHENVPAETAPDSHSEAPEAIAEESDERPVATTQPPTGPARPVASATTLAEEGRLLAKAHQLVQSGQGQQALEVLRTLELRYPRSVLYQEREVLTVEALSATGASGAAKSRAERFLKRHPKSPHAGKLLRFVE